MPTLRELERNDQQDVTTYVRALEAEVTKPMMHPTKRWRQQRCTLPTA